MLMYVTLSSVIDLLILLCNIAIVSRLTKNNNNNKKDNNELNQSCLSEQQYTFKGPSILLTPCTAGKLSH